MLMTEDQKKYYKALKRLSSKRPQKPIPKPSVCCFCEIKIDPNIIVNLTYLNYAVPVWQNNLQDCFKSDL